MIVSSFSIYSESKGHSIGSMEFVLDVDSVALCWEDKLKVEIVSLLQLWFYQCRCGLSWVFELKKDVS